VGRGVQLGVALTRAGRRWPAAGLLTLALLPAPAAPALSRLGPAPNFALTTQQNDRLWLTQLRDRVVVLTFTCTTCRVCPDLLPALRAQAERLGGAVGRRVFFVAVSVDPARDSPAVLRRFLHAQTLDPAGWLLLTGSAAEVDVVTRRYGITVERTPDGVRPDCRVLLIDGAGTIRASYDAAGLPGLAADLDALLAPGS
jgi:protein SCO1